MKKLSLAVLSMLFVLLATTINAQSIQDATGLEVFLKPVDANGNPLNSRDRNVINSASTNFEVTFAIGLTSSDAISKVNVKLGSTLGTGDKATHVLNFDGTSLPSGVTLEVKNNTIYVVVGSHTAMQNFFAEATLEDATGTKTAPVTYSK